MLAAFDLSTFNVRYKSMLQRIHIIGGPGSGKTYAARHLSDLLGFPRYDLDDWFWDNAAQSYGVRASDTERDANHVHHC